jgi:hypothetical protein
MQEPEGIPKDTGKPVIPKATEDPAEPEDAAKLEKEKEPEITIKQVPMDGVCGGY